jgi:CBS domain-containing protein
MTQRVLDVMTRTVAVAHAEDPFPELVRLMREFRVSALPVLDADRKIVGIVSESDLLLREELELLDPAPESARDERPGRVTRGDTAGEAMTSPAVTIEPEASLLDAVHRMHENTVKRLPVVDPEGHVVGIVSRVDLLGAFLLGDEDIADGVRRALAAELFLPPEAIAVTVHEGRVCLEGEVELRSQAEGIITRIGHVPGVVKIDDRLMWEVDDVAPADLFLEAGLSPEAEGQAGAAGSRT